MSSISRARVLTVVASAPLVAVPQRIRAQDATPTIRFGTAPTGESYLLPVYALETQIFARHGLKVSISAFPSAGAIATALVGGALDVGVVDPILVANASIHGVPLVFFAGGGLYSTDGPSQALCVSPTSSIRTAKDLEGQAVGVVSLSSISALGVKAWLSSSGADLEKIKLFEIPYSAMVPALENHTLAAAFIGEPYLSEQRSQYRLLAKAFDAVAKSFLITGCFTTRTWLAQNPATIKTIGESIAEAATWANTHHDDAAVIVAKYASLPVNIVRQMSRINFGPLDPKLMQPVLDAALKFKSIERPVDAATLIAR